MKIVKVGAGWCSACNQYQPTFDGVKQALGFQHPDVTWEEWNADTTDVSKYGITSIPVTLALAPDGRMIKSVVGNIEAPVLAQFIMDAKKEMNHVEEDIDIEF